ncbi:MAG: hypothetical protein AABX29_02595 [Nanoarchaeota archaeon]
MSLNLRISFNILLLFLVLVFVSAENGFFQIKNGLNVNGLGSFESNLPKNSLVNGNVTKIGNEYFIELLEGEKFIPEKKYVNNIFGIVNFRTIVKVNLLENGEKAVITGDGSLTLPAIRGYIIKGSNMNLTLKNGVFSEIKSLEINGDSSFDFNGVNLYIPEGVIFEEVKIISGVVKSFTLKNKLDKDISKIDVDKIKDIRIKKGNENYVKINSDGKGGYWLIGKGASVGELYELKEEQKLTVDSTGKISVPSIEEKTITLRSGDREVLINKLESDVRGVKEIKPFARGDVKIVDPGQSIREVEGAAVQFGEDKDKKLNLVFKDFSAANVVGYGKIENGKPYPSRISFDVGTTTFVNHVVFYNGNKKIEQVYEGSSWKEISSGKIVKTKLDKEISNDETVANVLGLLGDARGIGRGAFLEYGKV